MPLPEEECCAHSISSPPHRETMPIERLKKRDLPEAVAYANEHRVEPAQSSSIYGGSDVPTPEITSKINAVVTGLLDTYQSLPPA